MTIASKRILTSIIVGATLMYVCTIMIRNPHDIFAVIWQKTGFPFVYREYKAYGGFEPAQTYYSGKKLVLDLTCVVVLSVGIPLLIFRKKGDKNVRSDNSV